jgi:uncharacterized RDD family membrane protein YckC
VGVFPSTLDQIRSDRQLQDHWIRRLIAIIIDGILVGIVAGLLSALFLIPFLFGAYWTGAVIYPFFWYYSSLLLPLVIGVLSVIYFSYAESTYGWTFGKKIMNLKVIMLDGSKPSIEKALIRNLSKIHGVLLLLDFLIGFVTQGDPHQKYMDRIAGTTVTAITLNVPPIVPTSPMPPALPPPTQAPFPTALTPQPPPKPVRRDHLGIVSFGVFLLLIALTLMWYPSLPGDIAAWLQSWNVYRHPVMPPIKLIASFTVFADMFGGWLILLAVIRIVSRLRPVHAVGDVTGAFFFLSCSYILKEYSMGAIAVSGMITLFLIVLAVVIIIGGLGALIIHD